MEMEDLSKRLSSIIVKQVEKHKAQLSAEAKKISSEWQLLEIHEALKKTALEDLNQNEAVQSDKFAMAYFEQQLLTTYYNVFNDVILTKEFCTKQHKKEYKECLKHFETEMSIDLNKVSQDAVRMFEENLGEDPGGYSITKTSREEFRSRLVQKMNDKMVAFNQKPVKPVKVRNSALTYKNLVVIAVLMLIGVFFASGLIYYLQVKFIPIKNQTVPSTRTNTETEPELKLTQDIKNNLKKYYKKVLENSMIKQDKQEILPLELSCNQHHNAVLESTFTFHRAEIIPQNVLLNSQLFLDKTFQQKFGENIIIGMDFGSKYTRAAVYFDGRVRTIPNFEKDGEISDFVSNYVRIEEPNWIVGQSAENDLQSSSKYEPILYDMKAIPEELPLRNKEKLNTDFILTFNPDTNGNSVSLQGKQDKTYPLEVIISAFFKKVKENTETYLGAPVEKCVLTVPHGWHEDRRKGLQVSGEKAGFQVVEVINETIAVGIAARHFHNDAVFNKVLLIQLGARYWGISILQWKQDEFETISSPTWSKHGFQLKNNLVSHLIDSFRTTLKSADQTTFLKNSTYMKILKRRVFENSEKAIISLSTENITTVFLPNFYEGRNLNVSVTREVFENLNEVQFAWLKNEIDVKPKHAVMSKYGINNILFAGGCSKIPRVQQIVKDYFKEVVNVKTIMIDPENVVAFGAAVNGAKIVEKEFNSVKNKRIMVKSK